jgi:pSer/pThr/pTyr-binding forkhead associated (FHA) protein
VRFSGDGDWRHIGYKVARPGAIEIAAEDAPVTVGRVAGRADIVIPVATVSGAHARLEKKDGRLLVTDLDSTNGTYINERRLNPGFPIPVEPGSFVIFGDIHLAMFRARKTTATTIPDADADEGEEEDEEEEVTSSDTDAPEAEVAVSAAAAAAAEDTAS